MMDANDEWRWIDELVMDHANGNMKMKMNGNMNDNMEDDLVEMIDE